LEQWFEETIVIDYKNIDSVKIEIDREWVPKTPYMFKNGMWNKNNTRF